jgi:hypothetical protein
MLFGSTWPLRVRAGHNNTYHPEFKGSFSLKSALPALVPDLSYDNMEVGDGVSARRAWDSMVRGNPDVSERARVTDALLAYCRQDALAMVRLV